MARAPRSPVFISLTGGGGRSVSGRIRDARVEGGVRRQARNSFARHATRSSSGAEWKEGAPYRDTAKRSASASFTKGRPLHYSSGGGSSGGGASRAQAQRNEPPVINVKNQTAVIQQAKLDVEAWEKFKRWVEDRGETLTPKQQRAYDKTKEFYEILVANPDALNQTDGMENIPYEVPESQKHKQAAEDLEDVKKKKDSWFTLDNLLKYTSAGLGIAAAIQQHNADKAAEAELDAMLEDLEDGLQNAQKELDMQEPNTPDYEAALRKRDHIYEKLMSTQKRKHLMMADKFMKNMTREYQDRQNKSRFSAGDFNKFASEQAPDEQPEREVDTYLREVAGKARDSFK